MKRHKCKFYPGGVSNGVPPSVGHSVEMLTCLGDNKNCTRYEVLKLLDTLYTSDNVISLDNENN